MTASSNRKESTFGSDEIGKVLLAQGVISRQQYETASTVRRRQRRPMGEVLLDLGYVGGADVARASAKKLGLQYADLTEKDVDPGATNLLDRRLLRRHGVLPLRVTDGRFYVAMSDPTDLYALEDLKMLSGHPVVPVVATEREIERVFNKVFAIGKDVSNLLEEATEGETDDGQGDVELGVHLDDYNAPVIRLVGSILQRAVGEGASDIHVEPRREQLTVRFRVDGVLREVVAVPPKLQSGSIARLKILADLDIAERRLPQDGRFSVKLGSQKIDVRVATLPTVFGEKVVLRLLDTGNSEADLSRLGFLPEELVRYERVFRRPYGTVLVTGPTGSGKSTTLYATLKELNTPQKNIITVEDPVEYRIKGVNQVQVNPRAGLSFASGLRSILRCDPDIVMIGEIRDRETAKASVEAALTGHLVLATLHTNDAPAAVTRLTDMGVEPFLTASAVDCVIAQRLARRLCERCKRPVDADGGSLAQAGFPFGRFAKSALNFCEPVGCDRCAGVGYRGRVGIYELMVVSDELRKLVLRRAPAGEVRRAAESEGMIRLREDGLIKAAKGITTVEEVLRTVT